MSNTAEISVFEKIPLVLSVVNQKTGESIPNAILSNVSWGQDNEIGTIIPDTSNPNLATYIPNKAGTTHIQVSATITIP